MDAKIDDAIIYFIFIYIIYTEISVQFSIAGLNGDLYKMIWISNKIYKWKQKIIRRVHEGEKLTKMI